MPEQRTMKGVIYLGSRTAEVREFPVPKPGRGEVLIQMKVAAICGSDLHRYRLPKEKLESQEPWIPGHEPAGVVAELGECTGRVKVGDRVSIHHWLGCGFCRHCLAGMMQWCDERQAIGHPVHRLSHQRFSFFPHHISHDP